MTGHPTTSAGYPANGQRGTLYLVPAPLDFGCDSESPLTDVLPLQTIQIAARLGHWICENAKSTRAVLNRVNELQPLLHQLQSLSIQELPREVHKKGDHAGQYDARPLLQPAMLGHDVGLISEAGMPAVADPGSSVVRAAHDLGITVVALVGPVSLLLALASSGLNSKTLRSWATCPKSLPPGWPVFSRLNLWRSRLAKPNFSLRHPTAMRPCCKRCCKLCNTTRV